jgi:hypothetical protein
MLYPDYYTGYIFSAYLHINLSSIFFVGYYTFLITKIKYRNILMQRVSTMIHVRALLFINMKMAATELIGIRIIVNGALYCK